MMDIDRFVRDEGDRMLFIYGEWDPWTGGRFELGNATDSLRLVQAEGSHGSRITRLSESDRDAAFAKIEAWTGIRPAMPTARTAHEVREPRVPPAFGRALRARRLSP